MGYVVSDQVLAMAARFARMAADVNFGDYDALTAAGTAAWLDVYAEGGRLDEDVAEALVGHMAGCGHEAADLMPPEQLAAALGRLAYEQAAGHFRADVAEARADLARFKARACEVRLDGDYLLDSPDELRVDTPDGCLVARAIGMPRVFDAVELLLETPEGGSGRIGLAYVSGLDALCPIAALAYDGASPDPAAQTAVDHLGEQMSYLWRGSTDGAPQVRVPTALGSLVARSCICEGESRGIAVELEKPDRTFGQILLAERCEGALAQGYPTPFHVFTWDGVDEDAKGVDVAQDGPQLAAGPRAPARASYEGSHAGRDDEAGR